MQCNNNPQAIEKEIQHLWEDSVNKPSTDEWKTTNKTKKTEIDKTPATTQPKSKEDGGGGRGAGGRGAGRGREAGGRGSGGRGVSAGRGPSSSSESTPQPAPASNSSTSIASAGKKDKEKPRPPRPSSESTSVPLSTVSAPNAAAWSTATGVNWASMLKKSLEKEEKEKEDLEVPVEEIKDDIAARSRRKARYPKDKAGSTEDAAVQDINSNVTKISIHDDNIGQGSAVKLTEIVPSLTQSHQRSSQSNAQQENEPPVSNQEQTFFQSLLQLI